MKKKNYSTVSFSEISLETSVSVLAASIIDDMNVQITGQEIANTYDFKTGDGAEDKKFFNHEWE